MKNKILGLLILLCLLASPAFATSTPHYSYVLPTVGASQNVWGGLLNTIINSVDANIWSASGGTTVGPNATSSATSVTLTNPLNNIQNVSFSAAGQNLVLPAMNATQSPVLGGTLTINNTGSYAFAVLAQDSATILSSTGIFSTTVSSAGSGYVGPLATGTVGSGGSGYAGPVATGTISSGGTLYNNGTYFNVPLTGGTGSGAQATVLVSGNIVVAVTITSPGVGYLISDSLSASAGNLGGAGSGFTYAVATLGTANYTNVALTGGTGSGARANIAVTNGAVASVILAQYGSGFLVADSLSASNANLGGAGSGFAYTVSTLGSVTYFGIAITGGSGSGATANITLTNGVPVTTVLANRGTAYAVNDTVSVSNSSVGGHGSGFGLTVSALENVQPGATLALQLTGNGTANGTFTPTTMLLAVNALSDVISPLQAITNLGALSNTKAAATYAPIANPVFTGTATIPSAAVNSTSITQITGNTSFTGSPTLTTTPTAGSNNTTVIDSAYVDRGASGASEILLGTAVASNSPSVSFTNIPAGYDKYTLKFTGAVPATASTNLIALFSENNGSSYISTATYQIGFQNYSAGGGGSNGGYNNVSNINLTCFIAISTTAGYGVSGSVEFTSLGSTSLYKTYTGNVTTYDGTRMDGGVYSGAYTGDTNAINAIQVSYSTGNIASGTFALYATRNQ